MRDSNQSNIQLRQKSRSSASSSSSTSSVSEVQCYNCSGSGHISRDCTAPKREKGSCFCCESTQHQLKDCTKPKPTPTSNRIALIGNASDSETNVTTNNDGRALDEVNSVSFFLSLIPAVQLV